MLPLWKRNRMAMRSRRPAAGVPRERSCRNGSEMRKMVPLWKGGERRMWRRGAVVGEQWERHAATAENRGKCCRCGRGTGWQCGPEGLQQGCREMAMRSRRPAAVVPREGLCRNGSEMRKLLPLWKCGESRMWPRGFVSVVPRERPCRNGSEMQEVVPLWKGGERRMWRRGSVVGEQWERHAATAENRGCRCGRGTGWQCGPEGLQQGCREKGHAATAAKCGNCCRCGRGRK